jgi:hypothetical protein
VTAVTAVEDTDAPRSECWCCGRVEPPDRLVHLGNHPEVAVCIRCAYSLRTWARDIEDRDRVGVGVRLRGLVRQARVFVIRRGWHQAGPFARPLRWLGRRLP